MRHPERGQRPRRSFKSVAKRNGQNQALQRAGIYEGVFVTFHRQSYFPPYKSAGARQLPYIKSNGRCTECAPTKFARVQSLRKTQNKKQGYRMVSYRLRGLDAVCCNATNKQFRLSAYAATSCEDRSIALSSLSLARVRSLWLDTLFC